ncbi:MAG: hypothetical protein QOE37_368 [Microbacteriaceae bacterium]|nr:hypothetical protein [Microbacteriaceae bacterium]
MPDGSPATRGRFARSCGAGSVAVASASVERFVRPSSDVIPTAARVIAIPITLATWMPPPAVGTTSSSTSAPISCPATMPRPSSSTPSRPTSTALIAMPIGPITPPR